MPTVTNTHVHIFSGQYAPDYYLRVALPGWLDGGAPFIKSTLESKGGRIVLGTVLKGFNLFTSKKKRVLFERYLEFIRIGTMAKQQDVLNALSKSYKQFPAARYVALSLNMDHMDIEGASNHAKIDVQLKDLEYLKSIFPNDLFPFVSVDPRHNAPDLLKWLQGYLRPDGAFYGIKIYPSKGFFPFDPRLEPIYKWAEANNIPLMTHCTRSGSFYIGKFDKQVFHNPSSLNPGSPYMDPIYKMINAVIADKGIHKKNDQWCNIYTHPLCYMPVLEKFPNLKICFAHLGGSNEVLNSSGSVPSYLGPNWYKLIRDLLSKSEYPNIHADISYTLSSEEALKIIYRDLGAHDRLLFGTDFYMTEQETLNEPGLIDVFRKTYPMADAAKLSITNPRKYLQSSVKGVVPV